MFLYWHQSTTPYPEEWSKIYAQKTLHVQNLTIHLQIIGYSHQIEIYQADQMINQEILASQIPANLQTQTQKIELTPDFALTGDNFQVYTKKEDSSAIKTFLNQPDLLQYDFGEGALTAIGWAFNSQTVNFQTLHVYPEKKINLWSKSTYPTL